jgi:hypothetical protein
MSLNEAQVRAVAVTLQVLEERCAQMRRLISNPAYDGALHQVVDDIPPAARGALLHQITAIEAMIARLAAEFQISASPHSARQMLVALLSSSWEHLEDTRPAKLRRYGPVDPVIATPLDAELARLVALITAMCAETKPESAAGRTFDVTH